MQIKVFKFGGASVKDAEGVKKVGKIIQSRMEDRLVIVVSAMGKTTNALEKVAAAYFGQTGMATALFEKVKKQHFAILSELFPTGHEVFGMVNDLFVEVDWVLEDPMQDSYDYLYDQIVSIGELVSTRIVAAYLNLSELPCSWLDARDVILTDDNFREARINWTETKARMDKALPEIFREKGCILTQGFIGSTSENLTTTLGREGSDFTAAIFSHCLDAIEMVIWKDVPGILTADPRLFDPVVLLDRLSYKEAIEMTYYGAKVIHPKTIKPLQNKSIPLWVKSFEQPEERGTLVSDSEELIKYPPVVVVEKNQCLLHFSTRDFSFVAERHLSDIFKQFDQYRIKVNMMQNMAISFSVCITNKGEQVKELISELEENFKIVKEDDLELLTVRHYHEDILKELTRGKVILFEERIRQTVQMVVRSVPLMRWREES